jgi:Zn-dependent peptidase ImmA (M78 family)/transcriptional regulator with XRE-family HTH domain
MKKGRSPAVKVANPGESLMPRVNPDILRWARETAGLTSEEAARRLALKPKRGVQADERLAALESGSDTPTRPQLVKMAKLYRRPLLTFYLAAPPGRGDRGTDFRNLGGPQDPLENALLDALIRGIRSRQSLVRAILEDEDEAEPVPFIGSQNMTDGVGAVLARIETTLQVTRADLRAQPNSEAAFRRLREAAERAGVFVILMGDLGSYHTALSLEVFRGFSVADEVAPFVVINDRDSRAAWSFTLVHELAHLCLGQTGVSALNANLAVEKFCNDVAGEFLLPTAELKSMAPGHWADPALLADRISAYAHSRNLSSTLVAQRLARIRAISSADYERLSTVYRQHWLAAQEQRREAAREREGGPSFYVVRSQRVGNALLDLVARTIRTRSLSTSKAGIVLGVKAQQVQPLLDVHTFGGAGRVA